MALRFPDADAEARPTTPRNPVRASSLPWPPLASREGRARPKTRGRRLTRGRTSSYELHSLHSLASAPRLSPLASPARRLQPPFSRSQRRPPSFLLLFLEERATSTLHSRGNRKKNAKGKEIIPKVTSFPRLIPSDTVRERFGRWLPSYNDFFYDFYIKWGFFSCILLFFFDLGVVFLFIFL